MTQDRPAPPRLAAWFVSLVAAPEQSAAILGDLLEEFSSMVPRTGTRPARHWYWRQSLRTIGHLMYGQVRRTPAETVALAIGGFLLYVMVEHALQLSAQAVVTHSQVYYHVSAVTFWQAVDCIGRYAVPILVGWTVARLARGREMTAATIVGATETIWMLAIYVSMLLASSGLAQIDVPYFSMSPLFCPPESGPPHAGSVLNTLGLLKFTLIYWWGPTTVLLFSGAAISRMTSSGGHPSSEAAR